MNYDRENVGVALSEIRTEPAAPRELPEHARATFRGRDPVLLAMLDRADAAARADCDALLVGERGAGKHALALAIHQWSARAAGPFVAVSCGAIPRGLIAPELFGHEPGAFAGAHAARDGYVAEADGGTLFLDGLDELPLEEQQQLLRVLDARTVRRVGGTAERPVNVRILGAIASLAGIGAAAARLPLALYHRLATIVLELPPLRDRIEDLAELVDGMLDDLVVDGVRKRVTDDGWRALLVYDWPGNVRELHHTVWRAVVLGGDELGAGDFFPRQPLGRRDPLRPDPT